MTRADIPPPLPAFYDDLDLTLDAAWTYLANGVKDRHSAFHAPSVATVSCDGEPDVRTMILRGVDRSARTLRFHTDHRAGKLAHISANSAGFIHVYDRAAKIQLRLTCRMTVETSGLRVDAAWAATRPMSRACYQAVRDPGTPVTAPLDVEYDAQATNDGFAHFSVLMAQVSRIEWMYLAARGHARARFLHEGDAWTGTWLTP